MSIFNLLFDRPGFFRRRHFFTRMKAIQQNSALAFQTLEVSLQLCQLKGSVRMREVPNQTLYCNTFHSASAEVTTGNTTPGSAVLQWLHPAHTNATHVELGGG